MKQYANIQASMRVAPSARALAARMRAMSDQIKATGWGAPIAPFRAINGDVYYDGAFLGFFPEKTYQLAVVLAGLQLTDNIDRRYIGA